MELKQKSCQLEEMGKREEKVAKREGAEILEKEEEVGTLGRRKEHSEKKKID